MESMLKRVMSPSASPSPLNKTPAQFLSSLASPAAPSPSRYPSLKSMPLDTPSPAARNSPFVPESMSPLSLEDEPNDSPEDIPATQINPMEKTLTSVLQRLEMMEKKITQLEKAKTALQIENKRLEAKHKRLQSELLATKKIADKALFTSCQCSTPADPANNATVIKATAIPRVEESTAVVSLRVPQQKSFAQVLSNSSSASSVKEHTLPMPSSGQEHSAEVVAEPCIPNTYAGKVLSRILQSNRPKSTKEQPQSTSNEQSDSALPHTKAPTQRMYKPPVNLPPVATWTVVYFKNVPWTQISNIRRTLKACNIQTSRIVNLAWRKGKVLEVILDRNIESAFCEFLHTNLNWVKTSFTVVPTDTYMGDNELFNKPPAHIAITAFFAAIKRQAPTQEVAYFLKNHAIAMLSDFSDAPFEQLWEAAGYLERAPTTENASTA